MTLRLFVACPKHGETWALPLKDNRLLPSNEWPDNVEALPRLCAKCIAEAMAQPVRKSPREIAEERGLDEHRALRFKHHAEAERAWKGAMAERDEPLLP